MIPTFQIEHARAQLRSKQHFIPTRKLTLFTMESLLIHCLNMGPLNHENVRIFLVVPCSLQYGLESSLSRVTAFQRVDRICCSTLSTHTDTNAESVPGTKDTHTSTSINPTVSHLPAQIPALRPECTSSN